MEQQAQGQAQAYDSLFFRRHNHGGGSSDDRGAYGLVAMTTFKNGGTTGRVGDDDDEVDFSNDHNNDWDDDDVDDAHANVTGSLDQEPQPTLKHSLSTMQQQPKLQGWQRLLLTPLLPDDRYQIWGVPLLDGVQAVRCVKFFVISWLGLLGMFYFVRWMDFENDQDYNIPDMIVNDGQPILMDTMFFFVVGRLYKQRGIDHMAWLSTMIASGVFSSMETRFRFLQNSVTLYAMHCIWPWELWVFVIVILLLCSVIVILHVRYIVDQNLLGMKAVEMSLCVVLFLVPPLSSPYFHFHHWFAGWLVGMHCNLDTWWSRLTMAWCWGAYINGIAVYGRDPVLTCGYAFYLSYSLGCPYLECYIEIMENQTESKYKIMQAQDWWNCSATDYLP